MAINKITVVGRDYTKVSEAEISENGEYRRLNEDETALVTEFVRSLPEPRDDDEAEDAVPSVDKAFIRRIGYDDYFQGRVGVVRDKNFKYEAKSIL